MAPPSPRRTPTGRPAPSTAPTPGALDPVPEEPVLFEWIQAGGPEASTGASEPVLESASTPGWHSVTGGPDPVLTVGWSGDGCPVSAD